MSAVFDDIASVTLRSAADSLALRQRVIANNIANINTPHFLANRVLFEQALGRAVEQGTPGEPTAAVRASLEPTRMDGNNVNLDHEVLANVDTGLRYSLMLRALDDKFGLNTTVIRGSAA